MLTTPSGGILDDLMVTRRPQDLLLVVNAARKAADLKHLQIGIGSQPDWNLRASRSVPVHEQPPSGSGARP